MTVVGVFTVVENLVSVFALEQVIRSVPFFAGNAMLAIGAAFASNTGA